jgi:cytochrome d ubiquinol oxidase subunit II
MLLLFWFCAIAFCWAAFFMLEGFGLGVGALLPLVGRSDAQRGDIAETIVPAWAGNEGWLLAAAAATFFGFRRWFDGLVSGFGLLFVCIVGGLIVRASALHLRRSVSRRARAVCDAIVFVGSLAPAVLLGVLFANFVRGVTLDPHGTVRGGLGRLFGSYALLGGAVSLLLVAFQGATFVAMRTPGRTSQLARRAVFVIAPVAAAAIVEFVSMTGDIRFGRRNWVLGTAIMVLIVVGAIRALFGHHRRAFSLAVIATLLMPLWIFATLWPNVLPDHSAPIHSLTVHNAAASHGALVVLTIVAVELGALVLVYLTWSYWIFHARVTGRVAQEISRPGTARSPRLRLIRGQAPVAADLLQPVGRLDGQPAPSDA